MDFRHVTPKQSVFIYQNLLKHFGKVATKGANKEEKASSLPTPKLPVGVYEHPFTHEKVEKLSAIRANWINGSMSMALPQCALG